jgi:two-component system, sensor histidine kinase
VNRTDQDTAETRLVVVAPTGKDGGLIADVLEKVGVPCVPCPDARALGKEVDAGAAAVLVTEEALEQGAQAQLRQIVDRQPAWSDIPILVLTRPGADSEMIARVRDTLGNVTFLERPIRIAALVSAVQTALRARERQYQIRWYVGERERAEAALRAADARKDEFLATLAHELRNPLAPIRNAAQLLRMKAPSLPEIQWARDVIDRQVRLLGRLVDDLLDVSRITSDKIELRKERIDLSSVIRIAVETSRPAIDAAEQQLAIELPPDPVVLDADPVRLAQALSNLLNNASKFTPARGSIHLSVELGADHVAILIRDNGIGIAPEMLLRIFDMFTQADRSLGRHHGGLGIGLTLVKWFVEMHGGTVEARSAGLGKGSEFVVRLPVRADGAEIETSVTAADVDARPMAARQRILIVDDNEDGAETLSRLLRTMGNDVRTAADGLAAVAVAAEFRPHAALLDIGLPRLNGYDAARRIREQSWGRNMLLIAMTGWGQEADRQRSREAGFDHHLVKPVDLDALERLLAVP